MTEKIKHGKTAQWVLASLAITEGCSLLLTLLYIICGYHESSVPEFLAEWLFGGTLAGAALGYPLMLTLIQTGLLVMRDEDGALKDKGRVFDAITFWLGSLYSYLYLGIMENVNFQADWETVLRNSAQHTPVFTQSYPTVLGITIIGLGGYLLLTYVPLWRTPPLVIAAAIAAMYLGMAQLLVWSVQVMKGADYLPELLLPLNCLLIVIRTVRNKIREWNSLSAREVKGWRFRWMERFNDWLMKAERWPFAAFLLMWPLLGILIGILILFGQKPDAFIRAWLETGDWNLSQRVSPQNIYYDEHYLCTVAAGGHERIVKPVRMGKRHGHSVIVNRQLCVANAFEQVLEERTPRLHRAVRSFYDTFGFPIAEKIRSPYAADVIYFLMKPLEWIFLIVLYLVDVKPENRIAVQYTGTGWNGSRRECGSEGECGNRRECGSEGKYESRREM